MDDTLREAPSDDVYTQFAELTNRASREFAAERFDSAIELYMQAAQLCPRSAVAWTNLGIASDARAKAAGARFPGAPYYSNALALRRLPDALNNLGCVLMHNDGDIDGAVELLGEAAIRGHLESSAYNYSLALLMQATIRKTSEAWATAWAWYEKRPATMQVRGDGRLWRGEPLKGRTLLVGLEQGAGDQIWNLRWIRRARQMGAQVYVLGNPNIRRLLELQPYVAQSHDIGHQNEFDVDFVTMGMSMAGYLQAGLPEPEHSYVETGIPKSNWARKRIGLCWSGSVKDDYQSWRNLPFAYVERIMNSVNGDGIEWVSLQQGVDAIDPEASPYDNFDCTSIKGCHDLLDTARLVQSLDLVVTVDTMMPHLAAAVGAQVMMLNRWNSCWQWGAPPAQHNDPKWYGDMVVQYVQEEPFQWEVPVLTLINDLKGIIDGQ